MKICFYGSNKFSELKEPWEALETGEDMTAFQSYSWYASLNGLYRREKTKNIFREVFYVVAYENEQPIMIAPLQYYRCGVSYKGLFGIDRGIYFVGRQGYTDYINFIYKEFCAEAVECILDAVQKKYKTRFFCFEFIIESTAFAKYICEKYGEPYGKTSCAELVLPATFAEYQASLSKSVRQNIRTAFNRQKRDGIEFFHELICKPLDLGTREILMQIRALRVKDKQNRVKKNTTWKGKLVAFYNERVNGLFSKPHLIMWEKLNSWCFLVKNQETVAGFFWGIKDITGTKYYVIYAGVHEKYTWYSPTLSHFYTYIEELYAGNNHPAIQVFDFTRGGEKYKADMGCSLKYGMSYRFKRPK